MYGWNDFNSAQVTRERRSREHDYGRAGRFFPSQAFEHVHAVSNFRASLEPGRKVTAYELLRRTSGSAREERIVGTFVLFDRFDLVVFFLGLVDTFSRFRFDSRGEDETTEQVDVESIDEIDLGRVDPRT